VIGLFVLDPAILHSPDTGPSRVAYLLGALASLDADLRRVGSALVIRRGRPRDVVPAVAAEAGARLVTAVRDFGPHARNRDGSVAQELSARGRSLWLSSEQSLLDPSGLQPLRTFSACRRRFTSVLRDGLSGPAPTPAFLPFPALPRSERLPAPGEFGPVHPDHGPEPGERAAARRLTQFAGQRLRGYALTRDAPGADTTSRLSADLHFGVLSVRTVIRTALEVLRTEAGAEGGVRTWLDQIAWRDFYASVLWHFPEVATLEYRAELRNLPWTGSADHLEAWKQGQTGYPMVDAAMRQLQAEHFMHNRCRMIVASFLVKDLHLDWRLGERHFMRELVDGDLANNNGGWQWTAGTGPDSQPYFRILNPVLQGERHDPGGAFVRRWIPELRALPGRYVHRPWEAPSPPTTYPPRIVDHSQERLVALDLYRRYGKVPRATSA
jgi:deoxyribodipyrimidine photo-lyase